MAASKNGQAAALQLLTELRRAAWNRPELQTLQARLDGEDAGLDAAADYAVALGGLAGEKLRTALEPEDDGPAGEEAGQIVQTALRWLFEMVSGFTATAVRNQNRRAGLGLKAVRPHFAADRARNLGDKLFSYEHWTEAAWLLDEPVINFAQNVVDDFVRVNAAAYATAGLYPLVQRISDSETCAFCTGLAGVYAWPAPAEVFRRHERCRCKVIVLPEKSRRPSRAARILYAAAERKERETRIARVLEAEERIKRG